MRVSAVIPVKDDAGNLAECLRALSAQTRAPDEVIVVDNRSSDDSARVAAVTGARIVRCDEPGIPAASAAGYDAATGDIILRLDADCRPSPDWVEHMVRAFEAAPDIGAVTGGSRFVDGPPWLRAPLAAVYLLAYSAATAPALGHLPLFGSNMGLRRAVWLDVRSSVHRSDPEVHDDLDLSFHVGARHTIRYRRGLRMGMSMRPFGDAGAFGRRMVRGLRTVVMHWPHDFPPWRWARLLADRVARVRAGVNPRDTPAVG
ncbi:glycosyltransferase family 2 protein [Microbacterium thalassium]|uniref:glycosyltransferase family 2 protein n=1 Tax=Microbacterium thalassium TaxID=362649 RepID=UPI00146BB498|nr:glycosyltransferase family 2 protein [Microbacterium sp. MF43]